MQRDLEQYFTPDQVADRLVELAHPEKYACIIEPSAGDGAILNALRRRSAELPAIQAYDLEPRGEGIEQGNWLEPKDTLGRLRKNFYIPALEKAQRWHHALVIGNPPFTLAREFLRESGFADTIAMVLPISFMKIGHAARFIDDHHIMTHVEEIPEAARYRRPDGRLAQVSTCIAIFEWTAEKQEDTYEPPELPFEYVKTPQDAEWGIVRSGAKAGRLLPPEEASHTAYWIRGLDDTNLAALFAAARTELHQASLRTIGPPGVNKREIARAIENARESTESILTA